MPYFLTCAVLVVVGGLIAFLGRNSPRDWLTVGLVLAVVSAVALAFGGLVVSASSSQCNAVGHKMERPSQWTFYTDCMLQRPDGQWVPKDSYISNNPER